MENKFDVVMYLKLQKRSADLYNKKIEQAAAGSGLTKPEADVLLFFSNHPAYTSAADAVRVRGLSKCYVSKAVEGLRQKGLVSVHVNKKDRRFQNISLLAASKPAASALQCAQQQFIGQLTETLTEEEKSLFMGILTKMLENTEKTLSIHEIDVKSK